MTPRSAILLGLAALVGLTLGAITASLAQEVGKQEVPESFQPPSLTAHHEHLKGMVGTWDTVTRFSFAPGAPPAESKGTATYRMGPGGLWVIGEFKADMGGAPFAGHEINGFDPGKNKHVSVWVDSMSPALNIGEGTCENGCRKQTGWIDGVGMDGKPTKYRYTGDQKDDDHFTFEMFTKGPDGKEFRTMTITYSRRKA